MGLKRTRNIILLIVAAVLFFILGFYTCYKLYFTDSVSFQNWNLTLPVDLKKQYRITSFGALGDGAGFTVFSLSDKNEAASLMEGLSSQKNPQLENDVLRILGKLKVESQKYPDFSHNYLWKIRTMESDSRNKLYILYEPESSLLYYVEDIY